MDIQSFYHLTIAEFEGIYEKWSDRREAEFKNGWEQTRAKSYWSIKPYLKRMSMAAFMPFKWDLKKRGKTPKNQKVHDQERFEKLKKQYGATI